MCDGKVGLTHVVGAETSPIHRKHGLDAQRPHELSHHLLVRDVALIAVVHHVVDGDIINDEVGAVRHHAFEAAGEKREPAPPSAAVPVPVSRIACGYSRRSSAKKSPGNPMSVTEPPMQRMRNVFGRATLHRSNLRDDNEDEDSSM